MNTAHPLRTLLLTLLLCVLSSKAHADDPITGPITGLGTTQLSWVHANHMGVPIRYSDAAGQALAQPMGYTPRCLPPCTQLCICQPSTPRAISLAVMP